MLSEIRDLWLNDRLPAFRIGLILATVGSLVLLATA